MCHTLFISVCNFDMACSNCWCGMFGLKGVKHEFYTTSILNLNSYIYVCVCVCVYVYICVYVYAYEKNNVLLSMVNKQQNLSILR